MPTFTCITRVHNRQWMDLYGGGTLPKKNTHLKILVMIWRQINEAKYLIHNSKLCKYNIPSFFFYSHSFIMWSSLIHINDLASLIEGVPGKQNCFLLSAPKILHNQSRKKNFYREIPKYINLYLQLINILYFQDFVDSVPTIAAIK